MKTPSDMMTLSDPARVGIDPQRLKRLTACFEKDISQGLVDGGVVIVARHGKVVLYEAMGQTVRKTDRAARRDDVFAILSLTKSMVATLLLNRVERGEVNLSSRVADVIPEFAAAGKSCVTLTQVMCHLAGLAKLLPAPPEVLHDLQATVASICKAPLEASPGETVSYSGMAGAYIMAEIVRRLDGGSRSFSKIMEEDLFKPLGMLDTSLGQNPELESRRVPIVMHDRREGLMDPAILEATDQLCRPGAELPAMGGYGTAVDYFRFAEMLRRGGELDGVRILSPQMIKLATSNFTGDLPNGIWVGHREMRHWPAFPAFLGLGFYLRGSGIIPNCFSTLNSPGTYGHAGAGSTLYWVDPEYDMTFVAFTAGLLEESYSMERWQRLSNIVVSSIVQP
jgi:CubicO group peptidase (beta-lactamase class C family)